MENGLKQIYDSVRRPFERLYLTPQLHRIIYRVELVENRHSATYYLDRASDLDATDSFIVRAYLMAKGIHYKADSTYAKKNLEWLKTILTKSSIPAQGSEKENYDNLEKLIASPMSAKNIDWLKINTAFGEDPFFLEYLIAKKNSIEENYHIAYNYFYGKNGHPKSYTDAFYWMREAAKSGHSTAQLFLGIMLISDDWGGGRGFSGSAGLV